MPDTTLTTDVVLRDTVADGVLRLTLNRPDRLNAWTPELGERLFELLEDADRDPGVRVILLTGAGRGFCAGADMAVLDDVVDRGALQPASRPATLPATLRKPVIAVLNGACAGIGLAVAAACDLRFAAAGAKLTTAFARRGLVAEHGLSWLLPRLVGRSRAVDLLLSGRVVLAEEAHGIGLVDVVAPAQEVLGLATAYAADLATSCSPRSMAVMKRQLVLDATSTLDEAVQRAERLMEESFTWPDLAEGVAAFAERRAPRFEPLGEEIR